MSENNPYLTRVDTKKAIIVKPTDGNETILDEGREIFVNFLAPEFRRWGTSRAGEPTERAEALAFNVDKKDGNFEALFGSLGTTEDLCWEQGQINDIGLNYYEEELFQNTEGVFFLFKVKEIGTPLVAIVRKYGRSFGIELECFDSMKVWGADARYRIVVPDEEPKIHPFLKALRGFQRQFS